MRRQQALFNVNFSLLVTVVAFLPLLGALTCIVLSILLNFKESTWTHCRVSIIGESYAGNPNFLLPLLIKQRLIKMNKLYKKKILHRIQQYFIVHCHNFPLTLICFRLLVQ